MNWPVGRLVQYTGAKLVPRHLKRNNNALGYFFFYITALYFEPRRASRSKQASEQRGVTERNKGETGYVVFHFIYWYIVIVLRFSIKIKSIMTFFVFSFYLEKYWNTCWYQYRHQNVGIVTTLPVYKHYDDGLQWLSSENRKGMLSVPLALWSAFSWLEWKWMFKIN